MNDIGLLLPSGCRTFFADDVKIYMIIRRIEDCLRLQNMINDFEEWSSKNFLTLSVSKCNVITFHRTKNPLLYEYMMNNQMLQRVSTVRDLGITLDASLSFKQHYSDIIAKANRQLGFIFKIADEFKDPLCLKALYCALVRSIVEFGTVIWCPYQAIWIARMEAIQKKFVRYALRFLPWNDPSNLPPYNERCQLLGLETLENRRTIAQAVFAAKVLIGEVDSPEMLSQLGIYAPQRILRSRDFLHLEARSVNYGMHDPIRSMSARFNDFYMLFDFNVPSTAAFRHRVEEEFINRRLG